MQVTYLSLPLRKSKTAHGGQNQPCHNRLFITTYCKTLAIRDIVQWQSSMMLIPQCDKLPTQEPSIVKL